MKLKIENHDCICWNPTIIDVALRTDLRVRVLGISEHVILGIRYGSGGKGPMPTVPLFNVKKRCSPHSTKV
jgi:hypothetical protein